MKKGILVVLLVVSMMIVFSGCTEPVKTKSQLQQEELIKINADLQACITKINNKDIQLNADWFYNKPSNLFYTGIIYSYKYTVEILGVNYIDESYISLKTKTTMTTSENKVTTEFKFFNMRKYEKWTLDMNSFYYAILNI